MNKKVYVGLFLLFFFAVTLTLMGVSLWIGAYEGDLTRFGAVSERDYGWRQPLSVFRQDHTRYKMLEKTPYSHQYDIVVFGDSFSHMPVDNDKRKYGWPSYLYEQFGLTSYVYHLESYSVLEWLDNHDPDTWPDTIVYERLEGRLKAHEAQFLPTRNCTIAMQPMEYFSPPLLPMPENMSPVPRDAPSPFNLDTAIHWLSKKINPRVRTFQFPLKRNDLFSNRKHDHILIIDGTFIVEKLMTEQKYRNVACFLWEAKQKAESNGRTQFIIAVVPDKFTAYEPFIDASQTTDKAYDALQRQGLSVYRFDRYFTEQIASGQAGPDVYLPSDTHWGPQGARIFASGVYGLMQRRNPSPAP